jgi:hypothetical protein
MIPSSPLQFSLWGSALYSELAAGLWRALAAPWLEPGWPGCTRAPDRHRAPGPRAAPTVSPEGCRSASAKPDRAAEPRSPAEPSECRVIEVPRAQWQRRASRKVPSTEA